MNRSKLELYIANLKEQRTEIADSDSEDVIINKINLIDYRLVMYDHIWYEECLSLISEFHISILELRNIDKLEKVTLLPLFDNYIAKLPGLLPE